MFSKTPFWFFDCLYQLYRFWGVQCVKRGQLILLYIQKYCTEARNRFIEYNSSLLSNFQLIRNIFYTAIWRLERRYKLGSNARNLDSSLIQRFSRAKKKKSEKVNFFLKYKNCRISSKPHACVHNFENNRPRVLRFSINIEIEKKKPPADTALFMSDRRVVNWSSVTDIATQKRFRIRIIVKKKKT